MLRTIRVILAIYCWLIVSQLNAQSDNEQSRLLTKACSCSSALEQTVDMVSRIYAGFDDKVTPQTRVQYDQLLQTVRNRAKQADTQAECHAVLKSYTDFFKDSHVFVIWQKYGSRTTADAIKNRTDLVEVKPLNADYVYVKLAVFNQREVDRLDSMLRANASLIARTPNLIVDVRGNGGGNASTSEEMIKLIYTNPIIYPAWDYRSSAEKISTTAKEVASYKDTVANAFFYQRAKRLLQEMQAKPGALIREGNDLTRTSDADPAANPKRVALLIDKGCGSSTEFFIFESKQSKKVTLFGTNTHGVMDYGSDQNFNICDNTFNLAVPWGRNGWVRQYRIDNIGFAPDITIPATEKDWIRFVQNYYQKQKAN